MAPQWLLGNKFTTDMQQLDILFENEDFIVLNKPANLLSIPNRTQSEPSLKGILIERYGAIYTVHRLDKGTSGVIIFAKNESTHKHLSQQFEERQTKKIYRGLVLGQWPHQNGTINEPIGEHFSNRGEMMVTARGKPALTDFEVVERFRSFTWMQFHIHTGRTHQIRVHAKHNGHPIVCDELYGDGKPVLLSAIKKRFKLSTKDEEERPVLNRLALHAHQLSFTSTTGNVHFFEVPLPKDLKALLQQLKKWEG
jgi:23S rRNA pseudouridine955/2504/2580 synthase/23S rRNA pseudouridine1911/1915/1917 synthase